VEVVSTEGAQPDSGGGGCQDEPVASFGRSETVELDPRTPGPIRRLDVYVALGTTAFACLAYAVTLVTNGVPPRGWAVVLFTSVPLLAAVALVVMGSRARAEKDPALQWVSAGLLVTVVALLLQLLSFPEISNGGGPLATDAQSRSGLFLLYHGALSAGAVAGALGVSPRWRVPAVTAGVGLEVLLAVNAVPLPFLLRPDGAYTLMLVGSQWLLAVLVALAGILWLWRVGRAPTALRGWVGVALFLSAYDLVLNAIGGARFEPVWWSSLSVRVATYAVLAFGSACAVLAQLRDVESYADAELLRREGQLRGSLALTGQLLRCAEDLARAVTPDEVATVLCADAVAMAGVPHAVVLSADGASSLRVLGTAGYDATMRARIEHLSWDAPLPGPRAVLTGRPAFLSSKEDVHRTFPEVTDLPMAHAATAAVLPILVGGEAIGTLMVWGTEPSPWTRSRRELLTGLAAQGGQAIARAKAYEAQVAAANTLQESLLPSRLPARPDVSLAARYVAGERGLRVGGDWYDCVEVSEQQVALVVGDVMGKGLHAAALMGQMRTTLRSLTAIDPSPAVVLDALDRVTLDLDPDEIATVAYVLLDLDSCVARVARAGHLPPLLVTPDGRVTPVYAGGSPPLGAPSDGRQDGVVDVPVGSLLVLYSDGMVEDRRTGLDPGLPDFISTVGRLTARHAGDPQALASAVMTEMSGPEREDDVTLLVARYVGAPRPATVAQPARNQPEAAVVEADA
jgi:GAF domain-containing protein